VILIGLLFVALSFTRNFACNFAMCSFRLDRNSVVLHIAIMRSAVSRVHPDVWSSRIPHQWTARYRRSDRELYRVVVRTDPGVAVPDAQPHVRLRLKSHLYGVVAGHRGLFPEGSQVPCPGHQHSALWISRRSV